MTIEQLLDIWNTAQSTECQYWDNTTQTMKDGMVITSEGTVNNPDVLLDLVFEKLGINGVGASVGWDKSQGEGTVEAKIRKGKISTGSWHFTLADVDGNLHWDPYNPDLTLTNIEYRSVYVYGK